MKGMKTEPTTADRIAVCQHGDGPGDYIPAAHVTNGRCFMECDCTPRVYVALDTLVDDAAVERVAKALARIDAAEHWEGYKPSAAIALGAALFTEGEG